MRNKNLRLKWTCLVKMCSSFLMVFSPTEWWFFFLSFSNGLRDSAQSYVTFELTMSVPWHASRNSKSFLLSPLQLLLASGYIFSYTHLKKNSFPYLVQQEIISEQFAGDIPQHFKHLWEMWCEFIVPIFIFFPQIKMFPKANTFSG